MSFHVAPNVEPIPGYRLIERIGGGGFGEVWKAEAPGGLHKAIKIVHGDLRSIDADGARHAEQELRALKRLQQIRHPYLLSLERYDVVDGRLLIVTELADCNLWDRFREFRTQHRPGIPRAELLRYMEEAAEVLDMMNSQYQLQHLDIKPQNLFLVYNHVKVADFGLVKDLEGMRGQITGGVTPVYAAPETFDQVFTRYCDQYSLAIVYQELLTGVRPFNGTSGQQLLIQHLREPPNLGPLPPADRAAVGRALSKKPEDRFPSCLAFVRVLLAAGADTPSPSGAPASSSARFETPPGPARTATPSSDPFGLDAQSPMETPKTQLHPRRDDSPVSTSAMGISLAEMAMPQRIAPPEVEGDGVILPAVIVAVGQSGLDVAREFRRRVRERYGSLSRLQSIRILFVDTDSDTLHTATTGPGSLDPSEIIPARLNRPAHYLKPRRNGRSLIEGWFDPQMLYRIPRSPATVGMRILGRLAFLDHYRSYSEKLYSAVEAATHPDAMAAADRVTRLGLRTNRPRVYVVAGLGGGTGGGMFLDAAYAARHKLRQLGYLEPDVCGVFLVPTPDRAARGPGVANCYTALREMNHYAQPDTTFTADYEERDGRVNDPAPPFRRATIFAYPPPARPGTTEAPREATARKVADHLLSDLLSPLGRAADDARWQRKDYDTDASVSVVGQASYIWPREVLLGRTARWLGTTVLHRWTNSDPDVIGQYVKSWLAQRWQIEQLGIEHLVARLQQVGEKFLGQPAAARFAADAQPFVQKGWFSKEPDPAKLWQTMAALQQLVGMPDDRIMQRTAGQIEQELETASDALAREYAPKVSRLATTLLEHPDYRLVGAEEAIRQSQAQIDEMLRQYEVMSNNLNSQAIDAFNLINGYLNAERGQRRPPAADVGEAVKAYPTWRFNSLVLRHACRVYLAMRTQLADQLRELQFCRTRLDEITAALRREADDDLPPPDRILLPRGVPSVDAALAALQASLTADDLRAFDKKLQVQIEQEFNALFNVCVSSVQMLGNLLHTIEQQAKSFLLPRLGNMDLMQLFHGRFPDRASAEQAIMWLHEQATPPIKLFGSDKSETTIVGGPSGNEFTRLAGHALPTEPSDHVPSADEVLIYREYAHVPLTALPQLGPLAEDAYNAALDAQGGSPHSRCDVPTWQDVEVG